MNACRNPFPWPAPHTHLAALAGWQWFLVAPPQQAPVTTKPRRPFQIDATDSAAFDAVMRCMRKERSIPTAANLVARCGIVSVRADLTVKVLDWALALHRDPDAQQIKDRWPISRATAYRWVESIAQIRAMASALRLKAQAVA